MKLLLIPLIFTLLGCTMKIEPSQKQLDYKTSFNNVWNQVKSDKLESLPQNKISFFKLDSILENAQRTLDNKTDILEPFEKLAHPNGICFKGIWEIESQNIYSGYFKKGSRALLIARASTAMSNTSSGDTRAFGFAGKLFPTLNQEKQNTQPSANFFLIDDLGGTDAIHYTDVVLSNEPSVSFTFEVFKNILYALKVSQTFSLVDKNPGVRQLYEISELGESEKIITPKWMKIETKDSLKVDEKDFRNELRIGDGEKLVFTISVASKIVDAKKEWQKIGTITLDDSVVSQSCDHRLHFHHPRWRDDLEYGEN